MEINMHPMNALSEPNEDRTGDEYMQKKYVEYSFTGSGALPCLTK